MFLSMNYVKLINYYKLQKQLEIYQYIVPLKEISFISKGDVINVEKKDIEDIVENTLKIKNSFNLDGFIDVLEDYIEIFSDGFYSDRGFEYLYNPKTKTIITYTWSIWQREDCYYSLSSLDDYIKDMLETENHSHFMRYVEGLGLIFEKKIILPKKGSEKQYVK